MSEITTAITARQAQIKQLQSDIGPCNVRPASWEAGQQALPRPSVSQPKPKAKAKRRRKTTAKPKTTATPKPKAKSKRKQHVWTAAEKAAIGKRMKAVWAKRRKAKG